MVIINNIYRNIVMFCRVRVDGTEFQEIIRSDQLRNLRSSFRREFAVYGGFAYLKANNHDYDVGNSELYRIPIDGGSVELLQSRSN